MKGYPLLFVVSVAACAVSRPRVTNDRQCAGWKDSIQPLVAERCAGCHAGAGAAASYRVDDYFAAVDPRIVRAGDAASRLLLSLDPSLMPPEHAPVVDAATELGRWVVDCSLAYSTNAVHPLGFVDPASSDFHGKAVAASGYTFQSCRACHGDDFTGGKASASCLGCHAEGPTACGTCHSMPPESGAHLAHSETQVTDVRLDCDTCHVKPVTFDAPGHIDQRVAVTFASSALAKKGRFSQETRGCTVYCHGDTVPVWESRSDASCGACHGSPPENHASNACSRCHGDVALDGGQQLSNKSKHLDGKIQLGDGSGTCAACHGDASSPPGNGAHASHVLASHGLSAPIGCDVCHLVPASVGSAGHIDSAAPAEVFAVGVSGVAFADQAQARWDASNSTCTNYCHGSGAKALADPALSIVRAPSWMNPSSDARVCGACHGLPPPAEVHFAATSLTTCVECHPDTVDDAGAIVSGGGVHIDGKVQWRPR